MYRLLLIIFVYRVAVSAGWSYCRPDEWRGVCQTGKNQSPINIDVTDVLEKDMPPIEYVNYDRNFVTIIKNEGYTVALDFEAEGFNDRPSIKGSVLLHDYTLSNIHFHWLAEHTINNERCPLEAHFVHFKTEAGNLTNSLNSKDGVVVLAVFYKISETPNEVFEVIANKVKYVSHRVHHPVKLHAKINPNSLLPENLKSFFTYQGSLTTPTCNEVVTWIVYDQPSTIEQTQLEKLTNIYMKNGKRLIQNDRPLQPLNGREIFYTGDHYLLSKKTAK